MMNIPSVLKLIVAVFFFSILPAQIHALTPAQVFDKVKDAVVVVWTLDAQGKVNGWGSGVLLPSGKIATNCHVVEGGASYQVGRGNQFVLATLYAEDGDKDICLLDAKGITGKPVQLGKAGSLKVGVPVYAVGAPMGLELSLSDGIVSQLRGGPPPFIQTTAAISPGSSGGGLFDGEGRLVGLTTIYLEGGQSLNFAIPVEWIDEVKPGRKPATPGPPPPSARPAAPEGPRSAETMRDPITGMELVFVKGGCFEMGDTFGDGYNDEKPLHEVCLDGFWMGKYEVTQSQWENLMGTNPSKFNSGGNYPVESVSWNHAQYFLRSLNHQQPGKRYRLPTEAEWEYAARSGGKHEKWAGLGATSKSDLNDYAWYFDNSNNRTHPVGEKRPNGLGLYDMSGNVWEWCEDWYDENYYQRSETDNPKGPGSGNLRVLRGGSWDFGPWGGRASSRTGIAPATRHSYTGFRLALSP